MNFDFRSREESTNKARIDSAFEENGRKCSVDNRNGKALLLVHVDDRKDSSGAVIAPGLPIDGKRCDGLIVVKNDCLAHFIELKGNDVKAAYPQLENSIEKINGSRNVFGSQFTGWEKFKRVYAHIISNAKIPANDTLLQNKQKEFHGNLGARLEPPAQFIKAIRC